MDGAVIKSPALNVGPQTHITVNGKPLEAPSTTRLWLYHKPAGLITTHKDPQGRKTVFETLPESMGRVISVGRLDLTSEGLLLLTNNGELARHIELPSTGWIRRYRVRVFGSPSDAVLEKLARGVTVEGVRYGSVEAKIESSTKSNCWLIVSLKEGKNREIRKVFDHVGHSVSRLLRVAYGPFQLGRLERGEIREVTQRVLKEQLGSFSL